MLDRAATQDAVGFFCNKNTLLDHIQLMAVTLGPSLQCRSLAPHSPVYLYSLKCTHLSLLNLMKLISNQFSSLLRLV